MARVRTWGCRDRSRPGATGWDRRRAGGRWRGQRRRRGCGCDAWWASHGGGCRQLGGVWWSPFGPKGGGIWPSPVRPACWWVVAPQASALKWETADRRIPPVISDSLAGFDTLLGTLPSAASSRSHSTLISVVLLSLILHITWRRRRPTFAKTTHNCFDLLGLGPLALGSLGFDST